MCIQEKRFTSNLGWKELREVIWSSLLSEQGHRRDLPRLLRALYKQALKTAKDGDCEASLGILFECLTLTMVKAQFTTSLDLSF